MAKRKIVAVKDVPLFEECKSLIAKLIGDDLPESTVISAALTALRNQHVHRLITEDEATERRIKYGVNAAFHTLQLLQSADLIEPGYYEVIVDPEKGLYLEKDGELVETEKTLPTCRERPASRRCAVASRSKTGHNKNASFR